jgi:hypothetical protein
MPTSTAKTRIVGSFSSKADIGHQLYHQSSRANTNFRNPGHHAGV